jgi:DHA2 family multidrug resistance protein
MEQEKTDQPVSTKTLLAFFAMVVGMFMAILDIQIVASSLSVIGAGLSASGDELSWIQTSYLIAEVIIIPITGFASRLLSTRISYFIAALGFTLMSLLCALA